MVCNQVKLFPAIDNIVYRQDICKRVDSRISFHHSPMGMIELHKEEC